MTPTEQYLVYADWLSLEELAPVGTGSKDQFLLMKRNFALPLILVSLAFFIVTPALVHHNHEARQVGAIAEEQSRNNINSSPGSHSSNVINLFKYLKG